MSFELKSQINKAEQEKDITTLETIQENAEIGFEGEIAGLAKAAIDRLNGKVEDAEKTPDYVTEKLGTDKVENVTAEVDKEIEELQEKTEDEIKEVENSEELSQINKDLFESLGVNPEEYMKPQINPEAENSELEKAKENEEYWHKKIKEIGLKQMELANYDQAREYAKDRFSIATEYQRIYKDIADKDIIIHSNTKKHFDERIEFKGLSEQESKNLVINRNIPDLVVSILQSHQFEDSYNENPNTIFTPKSETTIGELLKDYKSFIEGVLNIPKPTQAEIDATNQEANNIWANYKKAQEEVKKMEA